MTRFRSHLLQIASTSGAELLEPTAFKGRVDEKQLEDWIVERPELLGEDLLILGRQLRDFEEDSGSP